MFHTEGYCRIYIELSIQVFYITRCFDHIPTVSERENQAHLTTVWLFFTRGCGVLSPSFSSSQRQKASVIAALLLPFSVLTCSVESLRS